VVAVVGYIGEDAVEMLPLKRGDLIVCDADLTTVKQGATRTTPLRAYLTPIVHEFGVVEGR
jgi:hypothetical protein